MTTIDGAARDVAFDKAMKVAAAQLAQRGRRLTQLIMAFLFLAADIQEADMGMRDAANDGGEDRPHQRELDQVLRVAFDVGAEVEHAAFTRPGWQARDHRRPADALQHPQGDFRHRHQGAGIAGRDDAIGLTVADQVDGLAHAAFTALTQGHRGLVLVSHHAIGVDNAQAAGIDATLAGHHRLQARLIADQN